MRTDIQMIENSLICYLKWQALYVSLSFYQTVCCKHCDVQTLKCEGSRTCAEVDSAVSDLTAAAHPRLLWCVPQPKTNIQMRVTQKQKTDTVITHAWGLWGSMKVDATRVHTRPPKTWQWAMHSAVCSYSVINIIQYNWIEQQIPISLCRGTSL